MSELTGGGGPGPLAATADARDCTQALAWPMRNALTPRLTRRALLRLLPALLPLGSHAQAPADTQGWSALASPLRLWVPNAPGSAPDLLARILAQGMGRLAGIGVTVFNVEGAGGELALSRFVREPANGASWLLAADSVFVINPSLYPRRTSDIVEGLVPVARLAESSFMLLVNPGDPIRTLQDLVRFRSGADLAYGSGGIGTQGHLMMEALAQALGLTLRHIPFRSNGHAATALMAADVRLLLAGASAMPLVRAGKLRVLAVTTPQRAPEFPDVPALAEVVPAFQARSWFGLFARHGTPSAPLDAMSRLMQTVLADAVTQVDIRAQGHLLPAFAHADTLWVLIDSDRRRYAALIRDVLSDSSPAR